MIWSGVAFSGRSALLTPAFDLDEHLRRVARVSKSSYQVSSEACVGSGAGTMVLRRGGMERGANTCVGIGIWSEADKVRQSATQGDPGLQISGAGIDDSGLMGTAWVAGRSDRQQHQ